MSPHGLCVKGFCDECTPEQAREAREAWARIQADHKPDPKEPSDEPDELDAWVEEVNERLRKDG